MKPRKGKRIDPNTLVLLKQIGIGVSLLALVALCVTGIWYGTRMDIVTIDSIDVSGGETINHDHVRSVVEQQLEGEYLGLIPYRFTYFYPQQAVVDSVAAIERVHSVRVERSERRRLAVSFDEYIPRALWCATIESDECFFLSQVGYAFAVAPRLAGGSFVRFVHLGEEPMAGRLITGHDEYVTALRLVDLFAEQGWYISHIELDSVGDAFLRVTGGGELKVALTTPAEVTVENLFVVLTSDAFSHIAPGNFEYVDLRFGSKVFVSEEAILSQAEVSSSTPTTSDSIESQ